MTGIMTELPESISRVPGIGGLPALEVHGPRSTGVIQLHGGQVSSFVPLGGTEMLWTSPLAAASDDTAIRGGVPICFPWFGSGPSGDQKPSHGLARLARWRVHSTRVSDESTAVTLVLPPAAVEFLPGAQQWPGDVVAQLTVTFGDDLSFEFTARNESEVDVSVEVALHTYLAVPDVRDVTVAGLDGAPVLDQVTGARSHVVGDIAFGSEVDLLVTAPDREITVRNGTRDHVVVTRDGCPDAVVWNPAVDKTARLADVPDDVWPDFVCVEAAAVAGQALVVPAGERRSISATYAPAR